MHRLLELVTWVPKAEYCNFAWRRAQALYKFQEEICRLQPDNYVVLSGIVAYLFQSITSTPTLVPTFVRHALGELHFGSVMARFGQFFISDLDLGKEEVIPGLTVKDSAGVYQQAKMPFTKKPRVRMRSLN